MALIAGQIRVIPLAWRLIDCSFGVFGAIPLLIVRRMIRNLSLAGDTISTYPGSITATSGGPAGQKRRQVLGPAPRAYPGSITATSGGPAGQRRRQVLGPAPTEP